MEKKGSRAAYNFFAGVGAVMCIVFGFMLLCNIVIIVKGTLNPGRPPSVFSVCPMVVQSGSMSGTAPGHIETGDLIFVSPVKAQKLKTGDVISFMEEASNVVVTHRIIEIITNEDGTLSFLTKGDANNTADADPVTQDRLVGIYKARIPKAGDFAMFLQTPVGMVVFIGIPLMAFIIYDIIRRQSYASRDMKKTAELEAELSRLRAMEADIQNKKDSEK